MPMSNDHLQTVLHTDEGSLDFQDYFVRRRCMPVVRSVSFANVESARPPPVLLDYFAKTPPEVIVLCPSNPFLSIDPILNVPGLTQLILDSRAPVLAISPIVNGDSLKGPTAKILTELGMSVCAVQIAKYYRDNYPGLISTFVIDNSDIGLTNRIQDLGLNVFVTHTIMNSEREKVELAESLLGFCG
jgi:LPPG:FO 2-phospho-L-lactate transferase